LGFEIVHYPLLIKDDEPAFNIKGCQNLISGICQSGSSSSFPQQGLWKDHEKMLLLTLGLLTANIPPCLCPFLPISPVVHTPPEPRKKHSLSHGITLTQEVRQSIVLWRAWVSARSSYSTRSASACVYGTCKAAMDDEEVDGGIFCSKLCMEKAANTAAQTRLKKGATPATQEPEPANSSRENPATDASSDTNPVRAASGKDPMIGFIKLSHRFAMSEMLCLFQLLVRMQDLCCRKRGVLLLTVCRHINHFSLNPVTQG
jgi:hypothetical protein